MKHLGDITKISGHTAPVVDVVIGGSPCQDLSIAGKRAGLDGERSGLFMEQIRIVKEMRNEDERNGRTGVNVRPRYMVWENVYGAFSSNKGEDFRVVLEEIAKVKDEDAVIPMPTNGKWTSCGCIVANGWSIAWRLLDAQFWGVPQRRRRIALVADFGGQSASEILFVRKSVSGDSDESKQKGKETSTDASRSVRADDCVVSIESNAELTGDKSSTLGVNCGMSTGRNGVIQSDKAYTLKIRSGCEGGGKGALVQTEKSATLSTLQDQTLFQPVCSYNIGDRFSVPCELEEKSHTLTARCGTGGNNVPAVVEPVAVFDARGNGDGKTVCTITGDHCNRVTDYTPIVMTGAGENISVPLMARDYKGVGRHDTLDRIVCQAVDCRNGTESDTNGALQSNMAHSLNGNNVVRISYPQEIHDFVKENNADAPHQQDLLQTADGIARTLASGTHAAGSHLTKTIVRVGNRYIVRRLTPMECERLQGYPDGWTDIGEWTDTNGKKHKTSDAARYKALGNSIALPQWKWVLKRICACYERDATMASLFDGIGGFPYLWEQLNGKGTCLWASEIEDFPIAVTKLRIGG